MCAPGSTPFAVSDQKQKPIFTRNGCENLFSQAASSTFHGQLKSVKPAPSIVSLLIVSWGGASVNFMWHDDAGYCFFGHCFRAASFTKLVFSTYASVFHA